MYRLRANDDGSILRPDDLAIYQDICYHDITRKDFDREFIEWPSTLAPDTPGIYEFRYFASRSCKRKWGTSAPVPFKVAMVDTSTLVDAAMFLSALQPMARDLAGLSAVAHIESVAQDVHPMQLDKHRLLCCEDSAGEGEESSAWTAMLDVYGRAAEQRFPKFTKKEFLRRFECVDKGFVE